MTTVAIVGGGAAGIGAARSLIGHGFEVVMLESGPRLGGNCFGVELRGHDGSRFSIDAGVSDFNRTTFTGFSRLVDDLGLRTRPIGTDTSFATVEGRTVAACRDGHWTFADAVHGELPAEIERFRRGAEEVHDPRFADWSLGRYLEHIGSSRAFRDIWALPRALGCFPLPGCRPERAPLRGLLEFWRIHGLVGRAPADRHCIVGGMHLYPDAFAAWFGAHGGELRCNTRVLDVQRHGDGVEVRTVDREDRHRRVLADHVVLTMHARDVLPLLDSPTDRETEALGRFVRRRARVVVHGDARVAGHDRGALGAFNYVIPAGGLPRVRPTITFFPKRLAGLPASTADVFVTMNPHLEPSPDAVVAERFFLHPVFSGSHAAATADVEALQGQRRTWYAGAYLRSPFVHESALQSGMRAADRLAACGQRRTFAVMAGRG